jgi:hypothetical protein
MGPVEGSMIKSLLEDPEGEETEARIRAALHSMHRTELAGLWVACSTLARWALDVRQAKLREEVERERVLDLEQRASGMVGFS